MQLARSVIYSSVLLVVTVALMVLMGRQVATG